MRATKKELPIHQAIRHLEKQLEIFINEISKTQREIRRRLYKEVILGILQSGSTRISKIAGHIKDRCLHYHSREKRLSYELQEGKWSYEESKKDIHKKISETGIITDDTILALDFTDIEKRNVKVFEHLEKVHDGSTGKTVKGYWI